VGKTSIVSRALDAVAQGVAGIDEHLRNPAIFSGINENLNAICARLGDIEDRLSRLEAGARRKATGKASGERSSRERRSRRTRR